MNNLHITLTEFKNESRILKEANSLVKFDVFSKVFIAALHGDQLPLEQNYGKRIVVNRFKLKTRGYGRGIFFQMVKYFEYFMSIFIFYKDKNIKCINVHSLDLLLLGVFLKYVWKIRLIYDAHELETERNELQGFRKKISKILERFLIKHVDATIVVSQSISEWYASEYNIKNPVILFNSPNKIDLKNNNYFREKLSIREDQTILIYQGGLSIARGVNLILDAFKKRNDDRVVILFMGYGDLLEDINQAASRYSNIFFYPAVDPRVVIEYTSSADFGIHLIQNTCLNHKYCMPNKLFEYSMSGLPVLVSDMKDMAEFVVNNKIGAVISNFSATGINNAIDDLLIQDLEKMKINSYEVACKNSWEVQEKKMLEAYKSIGFLF